MKKNISKISSEGTSHRDIGRSTSIETQRKLGEYERLQKKSDKLQAIANMLEKKLNDFETSEDLLKRAGDFDTAEAYHKAYTKSKEFIELAKNNPTKISEIEQEWSNLRKTTNDQLKYIINLIDKQINPDQQIRAETMDESSEPSLENIKSKMNEKTDGYCSVRYEALSVLRSENKHVKVRYDEEVESSIIALMVMCEEQLKVAIRDNIAKNAEKNKKKAIAVVLHHIDNPKEISNAKKRDRFDKLAQEVSEGIKRSIAPMKAEDFLKKYLPEHMKID